MWGTILTVAALIAAAAAWIYAWRLSYELATAQRRLDRYNRALYDANQRIQALEERLDDQVTRLRSEIRWRTGQARFTPDMTVREAQALHPQAQAVLAAFHLGGCSSCAVDPDERLEEVARRNGLNVEELLLRLNQLLPPADRQNGAAPLELPEPGPVKLPNVTLEV